MRRRITVLNKECIRKTKRYISFLIDERPYNIPGHNTYVSGEDILIPESVYQSSRLSELDSKSFLIHDAEDSKYIYKGSKSFGDWQRHFSDGNLKFVVFGFDSDPKIILESKYSAILASYSDEQYQEAINKLKFEFCEIPMVISMDRFKYIGNVYDIVEKRQEAELPSRNFRSMCMKYIPEAFQTWDKPPEKKDYESEFDYFIEEEKYEIGAKETFIICQKL